MAGKTPVVIPKAPVRGAIELKGKVAMPAHGRRRRVEITFPAPGPVVATEQAKGAGREARPSKDAASPVTFAPLAEAKGEAKTTLQAALGRSEGRVPGQPREATPVAATGVPVDVA